MCNGSRWPPCYTVRVDTPVVPCTSSFVSYYGSVPGAHVTGFPQRRPAPTRGHCLPKWMILWPLVVLVTVKELLRVLLRVFIGCLLVSFAIVWRDLHVKSLPPFTNLHYKIYLVTYVNHIIHVIPKLPYIIMQRYRSSRGPFDLDVNRCSERVTRPCVERPTGWVEGSKIKDKIDIKRTEIKQRQNNVKYLRMFGEIDKTLRSINSYLGIFCIIKYYISKVKKVKYLLIYLRAVPIRRSGLSR